MPTYGEAFLRGNRELVPIVIATAVHCPPMFAANLGYGFPPLVRTSGKLVSLAVVFVLGMVACFECFVATMELDKRVMWSAGAVMLAMATVQALPMLAVYHG